MPTRDWYTLYSGYFPDVTYSVNKVEAWNRNETPSAEAIGHKGVRLATERQDLKDEAFRRVATLWQCLGTICFFNALPARIGNKAFHVQNS